MHGTRFIFYQSTLLEHMNSENAVFYTGYAVSCCSCKILVPYQVHSGREVQNQHQLKLIGMFFLTMMHFIRHQQCTLLGMSCGWSKILSVGLQGVLRMVEMERIIKDISVQIFLLSWVKIKENGKIISKEIGCVFFFSDEKTNYCSKYTAKQVTEQ